MTMDKLSDYKILEHNPNKHTSRGKELLKKSLQELGFISPLTAAADGSILDGNARYEEVQNSGNEPIIVHHDGTRPIIAVRDDIKDGNSKKARSIAIAANRIAEVDLCWDASEIARSKEDGIAEDFFSGNELERLCPTKVEAVEDVSGTQIEGAPETFRLAEDASFPSNAPYNIPELISEQIPEIKITDKIVTWIGKDVTEPFDYLFYNWDSDKVDGMAFEKTILSFYVTDVRFESFWNDPAKYATRCLNRNFKAIVEPNFSAHFISPQAVRLWNIYRSRWMSRYMQGSGLMVIPDIKGAKEDKEFANAGIPVNANCVSCQIHTDWKQYQEQKIAQITNALDQIKPKVILFYGTTKDLELVESHTGPIPNAILVETRASKFDKWRKENACKMNNNKE